MNKIAMSAIMLAAVLAAACGRSEHIPAAQAQPAAVNVVLHPAVAEGAAGGQVFEYY